jgi:hypothetical protein
MLRGGSHGQHSAIIAVGVPLSPAQDTFAVLPQDLEALIPIAAESRERVQFARLYQRIALVM